MGNKNIEEFNSELYKGMKVIKSEMYYFPFRTVLSCSAQEIEQLLSQYSFSDKEKAEILVSYQLKG